MSQDNEQSTSQDSAQPENAIESPRIPTREETEKALAAIPAKNVDAAAVLTDLAKSMLQVVAEVDRGVNLYEFVRSVKIEVVQPGHFNLIIDDKETGVDKDQIAADLISALSTAEKEFGKQLRPIELGEETNDGQHADGGIHEPSTASAD